MFQSISKKLDFGFELNYVLFSVYVQIADVESDADLVTVRKRFEDIHFQVKISGV